VVVATGDQPALVRIKAAMTATTIAEHFRDNGADVLLMMDSVTRFAMSQREVGLAIGEPPATRGYTPSVFAMLPRLLERSGTAANGTITGLYTVLVEGDDMNEPVADAVRSILDGHVVLSRDLAHAGHYPAVDVLSSVSRLAPEITSQMVRDDASELRALLAAWHDKRDLIAIGAYEPGADATTDRAVALMGDINGFLRQDVADAVPAPDADDALHELVGGAFAGANAFTEPETDFDPEPHAPLAIGAGAAAYAGVAASPSAIPPLNLAV
jgi:flagellum-specific ATP synthase